MNPTLHNQMQADQQRITVMQINATKNAQRANENGHPDHDTSRAVARRAWMREARYTIESEGLGVFVKQLLKK